MLWSFEPLMTGDPILACEDIIVTPHMAWYSEEAAKELKQKCAEGSIAIRARISGSVSN